MTDYKQPFKGTGSSPENVGSPMSGLADGNPSKRPVAVEALDPDRDPVAAAEIRYADEAAGVDLVAETDGNALARRVSDSDQGAT